MRRRFAALVAVAATTLALSTGTASATPRFPGAGFVVSGLTGMTVGYTVPQVHCSRGENSVAIIGVISPAIGTLTGWNATTVVGCASGQPWYRIQTWVNAVGGGHSVYPTSPGDSVEARVMNAASASPELVVDDLTSHHQVTYRMHQGSSPSKVAAAGTYAGAAVPNFSRDNLSVHANAKELGQLPRSRVDLVRNRTMLVRSGYLWSNDTTYTTYFQHH